MLPRSEHLPVPAADTARWMSCGYIDNDLTIAEYLRVSGESDAYLNWQKRISSDNGRTWSELQELDEFITQRDDGGIVINPGYFNYDKATETLYEVWMPRHWPGNKVYTYTWEDINNMPFNDHVMITENGGPPKLMKFEDGPDYDPDNPFDPEFSVTNNAYFGQSVATGENGSAYFPMSALKRNPDGSKKLSGVVLMRRDVATGDWLASNYRDVPADVSCRGLMEPDAAICRNGNIMMICRGSETDTTPGRKWLSVSTDGGKTISPIEELRYDDGSGFYSPSSIHRLLRSSKNGKLYWIANVLTAPPVNNGPRYPLQVFEIDEENMTVRKDSEVVVDDKTDAESERLQLSNFSVLENRETLDIEIGITRIGRSEEHFWEAGVDKYTFTPPV